MKILRVGDPHVKPSNLKESWQLIEFIAALAEKEDVDSIEFMGDQFDTHVIVRMDVLNFWSKAIEKLHECNVFNIIFLIGNHDQKGDRESEHAFNAMSSYTKWDLEKFNKLHIVDKPRVIDNIGYVPYFSSKDDFIAAAESLFSEAPKMLVAHQTFTGATYENGFYAEDGIDPALVPQEAILSGHIHKSQTIGKCFYPGTPKWDKVSDANEDKGVWVFEHAKDGSELSRKHFSTKDIVTPIYSFEVKEGEEIPKLNFNYRNHLILIGKNAWINKITKKYKGTVSIKAKPTDRKAVASGSKGTILSFKEHAFKNFEPIKGVKIEEVVDYIEVMNDSAI